MMWNRYRIDMLNVVTSWQESIVERVCQKLFGMAANIEQVGPGVHTTVFNGLLWIQARE